MKLIRLALGAAWFAALPAAAGEGEGAPWPMDLSLRTAAWSSGRLLDDRRDASLVGLTAKTSLHPTKALSLQFDGYAFGQSEVSGHILSRVRDAFARYENGPLEVRAGWQSTVWGRADTLNPTDQLTSRDYTLLVPTDDEQRFGTPAVKTGWFFDRNNSLALHVQRFHASILPTATTDDRLPKLRRKEGNAEWGLKFDHSGDTVDWSVSAFDGYDKQRQLVFAPFPGGALGAAIEYPHKRMLGADLATDLHGFGLRAEMARTWVEEGVSPSLGGKSGDFFAVVGVDHNLDGDDNVNLQYFFRKLTDFSDPTSAPPALAPTLAAFAVANNQIKAKRSGITLRYARQKFDDKFSWELQGISYLDKRDFALRPRLEYRLDNRVKLFAGLDVLRGSQGSYYGMLRQNSAGFVELRWVF